MPKLHKGQAYVPEAVELERLFKLVSLSKHAKRDKLLLLLQYTTGMRVLELASLKIYHVVNPDGSINENISLVRTKGNKPRMVYIPERQEDSRVHRAIEDYIIERKEQCERKRTQFSLQKPLFLSLRGGSFSNKTLQKRFEHLYKMAGIRGASSHSGRRTFATRLDEQGVDLQSISIAMGHSSISMTAKYVDKNQNKLKKISGMALKFL